VPTGFAIGSGKSLLAPKAIAAVAAPLNMSLIFI
jgi:hypothetical protein